MIFMVRWNQMKLNREIRVSSLLNKFKTGYKMLSNIQWVSAYGSHLSAATILGVVGLLLAVRDGRIVNITSFSTTNYSSEKLYFVPGLKNLGNNCFLNVVLQSLASCLRFRSFLEDVLELQTSLPVVQVDASPLLISLSDLLEELSTLQEKSRTLNPQKVMAAMQQYIPQFQLSNQQDAAEAFLHLLSCLRDELSDSYMPNYGSLTDVAAPTSRILASERIDNSKEPERWQKQYLGPFDGILGSFLTCQTCSSEIMMDFGFFHTLPLSPIPYSGASIMHNFTLEDCMKRFLAPEHIENYSCSRCWHIAATKFLSTFGGQQEDIRKLSCCSEQDLCNCRKISSLHTLPRTNHFSRAFKQLSIAHCPQILCFHLQRSLMNAFGEFVKIQGHIFFPLILDMSPFAKYEVGIENLKTKNSKSVAEKPCVASTTYQRSVDRDSNPNPCSSLSGIYSNSEVMHTLEITDGPAVPKSILYRLVSVVEHFGRTGSGHYTVYRGVTTETEDAGETKTHLQWFRISDSEVHNASDEDVLGAEATLLFYERI